MLYALMGASVARMQAACMPRLGFLLALAKQTDPRTIPVKRRDRLGRFIHEYQRAASAGFHCPPYRNGRTLTWNI